MPVSLVSFAIPSSHMDRGSLGHHFATESDEVQNRRASN